MEALIDKHLKMFDKYPYIIGIYWNSKDALEDRIKQSIKDKKPYNEYDSLSADDKKAFNDGLLLF